MQRRLVPARRFVLPFLILAFLILASLILPGAVLGQEPTDLPVSATIGAQLQIRYIDAGDEGDQGTDGFRIQRARLGISGTAYGHFSYTLLTELAGSAPRLLDAHVRVTLLPSTTLWVGQGKAHFGRQQLNSSRNLHFVDRSIVDGRFSAGRQRGVALIVRPLRDFLEVDLGLYDGEGIRDPVSTDDHRMTVARIVLTPWGPYPPVESAHDRPSSPLLAIGLSAMGNTVSVGEESAELTRLNGEAALRIGGLNATAELYRERSRTAGSAPLETIGWHAQAGYLLPGGRHEVALRRAAVLPDAEEPADRVESGIAYSHYLAGHGAKLQVDLRRIRTEGALEAERELRFQLQIAF